MYNEEGMLRKMKKLEEEVENLGHVKAMYESKMWDLEKELMKYKEESTMNKVWMVMSIITANDESELNTQLFNKHEDACDAFDEAVKEMADKMGISEEEIVIDMGMDENGARTEASYGDSTVIMHLHEVK